MTSVLFKFCSGESAVSILNEGYFGSYTSVFVG